MGERKTASKLGFYLVIVVGLLGSAFLLFKSPDNSEPKRAVEKSVDSNKSFSFLGSWLGSQKDGRVSSEKAKVAKKMKNSIWSQKSWVSGEFLNNAGREPALQMEIDRNVEDLISLFDKNEMQQLVDKVDELIDQNPDIPEYHAIRGDYYFNMLQYEEARPSIENLLKFDDNNNVARTMLAKMDAVDGNFSRAKQRIREVLDRDPGSTAAVENLMELYMLTGNPEDGLAEFKSHFLANSDNANLVALYSQTLTDPEQRTQILEDAYAKDSSNPLINQGLAREAFIRRDLDEALRRTSLSLENKSRMRSSEIQATESLHLELLLEMKQLEKAKAFVARIEREEPNHPALSFYRMRLEMQN